MNDQRLLKAGVRFLPWAGDDYAKGLAKKRLLVLGDSHYFSDGDLIGDEMITRDLVQECTCGDGYPFFRRIHEMLSEGLPPASKKKSGDYWTYNLIAFYNYLRWDGLKNGSGGQLASMYHDSEEAMIAVLRELRPTHVLILGRKTWFHFLAKSAKNTDGPIKSYTREQLNVPGSLSEIWRYTLDDLSFLVGNVYHPSARGRYSFDLQKGYAVRVIRAFLATH